jgi:hypothetical protein
VDLVVVRVADVGVLPAAEARVAERPVVVVRPAVAAVVAALMAPAAAAVAMAAVAVVEAIRGVRPVPT